MITLRLTPEVDEAGDVFVVVDREGTTERVGPLRNGEEIVAVLEDQKFQRGPPTEHMKKLARKQESRNAGLLGGRVQPGSGSSKRAKGDVRKVGEYRGESKFTFADSYVLKRQILEKVLSECGDGERAILFLDFKNRDTGRTHGSYVVLHETDFAELLKHASLDDS